MPAEWHRHERCWMAWPCRKELWGDGLDAAREAYAEVARAIAQFEPVSIIVQPQDVATVSVKLGKAVDVLPMEIDDSWTRDTAPTFLIDGNGKIAGCNWRFNGWGGKYPDFERDARLTERLLDHLKIDRYDAPFVLEGGAIHSDGQGTILTTESVLLNENRNPGITRTDMESLLIDWLGAEKVIWLPGGLEDDETDGHVDNVACFARPGCVLALAANDADDPNYDILQANLEVLSGTKDARGKALDVITVEQPEPITVDGRRLSASYVNLYVANGGVVMPIFGDPADEDAVDRVEKAFPKHEVMPVDASDIVRGGGGIHCITQQQPAVGEER